MMDQKTDRKKKEKTCLALLAAVLLGAVCLLAAGCGQSGREGDPSGPEETGTGTASPSAQSAETLPPSAMPTAVPTVSPSPTPGPVSNGHTVVIDPGHQEHANSGQEPIGPGAEETKPKVASGTQGVSTGVPEYELTLAVSLQLEQELKQRGYKVVMVRTANDVDISNKERADMAARAGGDVFIRIHANGSEDQSVSGTCAICPSMSNPYMEDSLVEQCQRLSTLISGHVSAAAGFKDLGAVAMDNMSGINWCTIPVSIVEMGFMTNPAEDEAMETPQCQQQIAAGIADAIDEYFAQ